MYRLTTPLCVLFAALAGPIALAVPPPLSVSPDGRHLLDTTGEPFIWIGDTAWQLFHSLDREEAIHYLDTRKEQGFTLIQAVILAENDGLRKPNAYGELPFEDLDPTRPNEAYFEHVDFIVEAAAERGLVMGLLPTWGDKVRSRHPAAGPVVFDAENAEVYARFLGKRYRDQPVVWILGGDRNVDYPESRAVWEAMGRTLRETTGGSQLITYHPRGTHFSGSFFHNADWLDFNMFQSGHGAHVLPVHQYVLMANQFRPRKPVVEGESAYEDIPVRFWEYIDWSKPEPERMPAGTLDRDGIVVDPSHFGAGFITAHDVRRHAYWNLLAGAAGYTYGNNAVWQMFRRGGQVVIPALTDWKEALRRPGAEDMRHVRTLWKARPFARLVPDQSLLLASGDNPALADRPAAAVASDGGFALVYLPTPGAVTVVLDKLKGATAQATWFDPRDGGTRPAGVFSTTERILFTSPSQGATDDWILILDRLGADFPEF